MNTFMKSLRNYEGIAISSFVIPIVLVYLLKKVGILELVSNNIDNVYFVLSLVIALLILYYFTFKRISGKNEEKSLKKVKEKLKNTFQYFKVFVGFGLGAIFSFILENGGYIEYDLFIVGITIFYMSLFTFTIYLYWMAGKFKNKRK